MSTSSSCSPKRSIKISGRLRNASLACLASPLLGLIALANPAQAATNLVQNGSFEINSGPGYVAEHPISNWSMIFIGSSIRDINAVNTFEQLAAGSSCSPPYTTCATPIGLWGVSPGYVNGNGIRASNDGGYFIIADGWREFYSIFRQEINGLTPGAMYQLDFEYAYAQQAGFTGDTYQYWTVSFGSENYETPALTLPSEGFYGGPNTTGWLTASKTFTASAASQTLQFLAIGTPGLPPMSLLDGVSLTEVIPPPASVPGPVPLLGLGATMAWSRRLRRRMKRDGMN
jgi:hypothetical protein